MSATYVITQLSLPFWESNYTSVYKHKTKYNQRQLSKGNRFINSQGCKLLRPKTKSQMRKSDNTAVEFGFMTIQAAVTWGHGVGKRFLNIAKCAIYCRIDLKTVWDSHKYSHPYNVVISLSSRIWATWVYLGLMGGYFNTVDALGFIV